MPSPMISLAEHALAETRADGVEYADCRLVELDREAIHLRDDDVETLARDRSSGVGVRVLFQGAWGFGSRPGFSEEAASEAARDAVITARAAARVAREKLRLAEEDPPRGAWKTPLATDPFDVPTSRKLADLQAAVRAMRDAGGDAGKLRGCEARMLWKREQKWFASTEGGACEQTLVFGGAGIQVTAADGDEVAVRTWPMSYDGGVAGAGYESVAGLDLVTNGARIREEALELLRADECPAGERTLVLDTPQLALQIHESCGHPTESDRAMGEEISLAGASFLTPDKLGKFKYGAPIVNLVADSTSPGGLGTFGWDDEGVPARRTPLVSRGIFVGYLSSRETAARLGLGRSAGCMRSESWSRPPIIRMINVSLEPSIDGPRSLEELVADTDDGILMTQNRSWSIDDLRLNFQFGCEAAWEIKGGRRVRLLKKPVYTGITPRFWGSCDTIGRPEAWKLWGFVMCGKGDPMQLMNVGHGCAPARFRNVQIGSTGGMR